MLDWKPGRSLLGFLTVKTAAEAPGQTMTGGQGLAAAMSALAGEDAGAIFQAAMPFLAPYLKERGIDVMKPYELQYGQDPQQARENAEIQKTLLAPAMQHLGQEVGKLINIGGEQVKKLTNGYIPADKFTALYSLLPNDQGQRDQVVGMIASTFARSSPDIAAGMQTVMRGVVLDWDPLIRANRLRNGNNFNPQDFSQTMDWFQKAHAAGHFGNVPAQLALEAVPFAIDATGGKATPQMITNLAQVASEIQYRGLARDFRTSMEMATSMGDPRQVLTDPMRVLGQIHRMSNQMDSMNYTPEQRVQGYALVQQAKEQGMSVAALMQSLGAGGLAARLTAQGMNTVAARSIARGATDALSTMGDATALKALTAYRGLSQAHSNTVDRLIAAGDMSGLDRVIDSAEGNPKLWRLMQGMGRGDTANTIMALEARPDMIAGVTLGDARRQARQLRDPALEWLVDNPAEFQKAVSSGQFSQYGLKPDSIDLLRADGPTGGKFVGSVMTAHQTLADAHYTGGGRLPAEQPFEFYTKPLDKLVPGGPTTPQGPVPELPSAPKSFGAPWEPAPTSEYESRAIPAPQPVAARPTKAPYDYVPPATQAAAPAPAPATAPAPAPAPATAPAPVTQAAPWQAPTPATSKPPKMPYDYVPPPSTAATKP